MTRIDAYLFKNSLKVILKLIESPLTDESKARIKAEVDAMIHVIDRSGSK